MHKSILINTFKYFIKSSLKPPVAKLLDSSIYSLITLSPCFPVIPLSINVKPIQALCRNTSLNQSQINPEKLKTINKFCSCMLLALASQKVSPRRSELTEQKIPMHLEQSKSEKTSV